MYVQPLFLQTSLHIFETRRVRSTPYLVPAFDWFHGGILFQSRSSFETHHTFVNCLVARRLVLLKKLFVQGVHKRSYFGQSIKTLFTFTFYLLIVVKVQWVHNGLKPLECHHTGYLLHIEKAVATPVEVQMVRRIYAHQNKNAQIGFQFTFC